MFAATIMIAQHIAGKATRDALFLTYFDVSQLPKVMMVSALVSIAAVLMIWAGITTPEQLARKRPYIIVGCFIFGMLLTPPDIISQSLLAIPMWILFEFGLIFSRVLTRKRERLAKEQEKKEEQDLDDEFEKAIAEEEKLNK